MPDSGLTCRDESLHCCRWLLGQGRSLAKIESGTSYQDLLNSWSELVRVLAARAQKPGEPSGSVEDGTLPQPPESMDPQLASILSAAWLLFVTSGVRYWLGAAETWAKLLPSIDAGLEAAREDPSHLPEARTILIDELRGSLRTLMDLSYRESRRVALEFEDIVQPPAADSAGEGENSNHYWRRWTVKP